MLSWQNGLEKAPRDASYLSAERARTIDLTDKATQKEFDTQVPSIQRGKDAAQSLHA